MAEQRHQRQTGRGRGARSGKHHVGDAAFPLQKASERSGLLEHYAGCLPPDPWLLENFARRVKHAQPVLLLLRQPQQLRQRRIGLRPPVQVLGQGFHYSSESHGLLSWAYDSPSTEWPGRSSPAATHPR